MGEYALLTGSSYDERGERQQGKTRQSGGTRSKRSVNLGRLADEVGLDLLGAALGVTDQTVRILVDGRDHAREPAATASCRQSSSPAAAPDVATATMPQAAEVAQQTLFLKPKKPAPAPVATPAPAPVEAAPVQEAAPAAAPVNMNRLGAVSAEVSLARAEALEQLFESRPRGVKGLLWKNILGFQLPAWGNIRRGHAKFRNTLADAVEEAMGLPSGWLDNPSYPPATLAAWVTTAGAALPPCPAVLETEKTGRSTKPAEVAAPAPDAAAPAPVAAPAPAAQVAAAGLSWAAAPAGQPGPICQALISILASKSAAGALTEQEALAILNNLMAR